MKVGDLTQWGEVSYIDHEKCFVQLCDVGGKGIHGVFSMTFEGMEDKRLLVCPIPTFQEVK